MKNTRTWLGSLGVCALLCALPHCTDDFSRFQFTRPSASKPRDAGAEPQRDATAYQRDAGLAAADAEPE